MKTGIYLSVLPLPPISEASAMDLRASLDATFGGDNAAYLDELSRPHVPLGVTVARLGALSLLPPLLRQAGIKTAGLILQRDERGRPYALNAAGKQLFDFNLSHSGAHIACALVCRGRVGVDIEEPIPPDRAWALTRRFASEGECALMAAGRADFTRLWTVREALSKHDGLGRPIRYDATVIPDGVRLFCGELADTGACLSLCVSGEAESVMVTSDPLLLREICN